MKQAPALQQHVLISDNSRVRKSYFLNNILLQLLYIYKHYKLIITYPYLLEHERDSEFEYLSLLHSLLTLLNSERPKFHNVLAVLNTLGLIFFFMFLLLLWKEFHISFKNILLISSGVDENRNARGKHFLTPILSIHYYFISMASNSKIWRVYWFTYFLRLSVNPSVRPSVLS